MIRHCTDGDQLVGSVGPAGARSHCGLTFDDIERSTICPHEPIATLDPNELQELWDAVSNDRALDTSRFRPELLGRLALAAKPDPEIGGPPTTGYFCDRCGMWSPASRHDCLADLRV